VQSNFDEKWSYDVIYYFLVHKRYAYYIRAINDHLWASFIKIWLHTVKSQLLMVIGRNFLAKKFFRLFLIFFAQTCSNLFIFETKPQIKVWGVISTQFYHWFQIWSEKSSNLIIKCFSSLLWRQYFIMCITKVCNIFKTSR
jgi:hypothetical protein